MRYLTKWIFMRFSLPLGDPPSEILPSTCNTATTQHYTKHRWKRVIAENWTTTQKLSNNCRRIWEITHFKICLCANSKVSDQIYMFGSSVSVSTRNKCRYIELPEWKVSEILDFETIEIQNAIRWKKFTIISEDKSILNFWRKY